MENELSAPDVVICECFARDGLQHEAQFVPTQAKVNVIDAFTAAGFRRIEATSYSHPVRVPAFSDASDVLAQISRKQGVAYKATCPNRRAVERAIADRQAGHGAEELSLLASASESHTQRNLRTSRAGQWTRIEEMVELAAGRFTLVGVVSMALGCAIEGSVDPVSVAADVAKFAELGVELVTIGDTIGAGNPRSVRRLFREISSAAPGVKPIAHFHNTRGSALANCMAALEEGCTMIDSAMGGVGGHPSQFSYGGEGFTGNLATEDLVDLLEAQGISTGIDLDAMMKASHLCEEILERPLHSMVARAGLATQALGAKLDV